MSAGLAPAWRRFAALTTATAALTAVVACGGDDPAGPAVEGVFTLVQVNSQELPALVYDSLWVDEETGNQTLIEAFIEEGELELVAGSYTLDLVVDVTQDGELLLPDGRLSESGSYTAEDGTLRLTPSDGGPVTTGTIDGVDITFSETSDDYGTFTLTFRR